MVALLANPHRYDGKAIQTTGFVVIEFEGDAIYLHQEDAEHLIDKNGIHLQLSESQRVQFKHANMRYAIVAGTFIADDRSEWSGELTKITRMDAWGPSPPR